MVPQDEISRLIERVALRDRAAFDALYLHTSAKLFGVALRLLKNRADAEDVLQDVYVRIWQRADRYQVSEASPMSWLITVARHASIDRLRSRPVRGDPLDEGAALADGQPGPEDNAILTSERRRIEDCLDELDDDRADAVRAAYLEGYSYKELALRHDVPLNTMRTWLRRSLAKLRDCLDQ